MSNKCNMGTYTIYRLNFQNAAASWTISIWSSTNRQPRFTERLKNYIPADTLFSAICQMWATFLRHTRPHQFSQAVYTRSRFAAIQIDIRVSLCARRLLLSQTDDME